MRQSASFGDLDHTGTMDILIPVSTPAGSALFILYNQQAKQSSSSLCTGDPNFYFTNDTQPLPGPYTLAPACLTAACLPRTAARCVHLSQSLPPLTLQGCSRGL